MKNLLYILLALFFFTTCQDDFLNGSSNSNGPITISLAAPNFTKVDVNTRSAKDGNEKKVTNAYMFIIDGKQNGDSTILTRTYLSGNDPTFTIDRTQIPTTNADVTKSAIVMVANITDNVKTLLDNTTTVKNLADIKNAVFSVGGIDIPTTGIPMYGKLPNINLSRPTQNNDPLANNRLLEVPMQCLYAKIVFNIAVVPTQPIPGVSQSFQLTSWEVHNVPNAVKIKEPANSEETKPVLSGSQYTYAASIDPVKRTTTNKAGNIVYESLNGSEKMSFTFYMPEHKVNPGTEITYPWADSPTYNEADYQENGKYELFAKYRQYLKPELVKDQNAAYVEIKGQFKDHNNRIFDVTYDIYLGKDSYRDFSILRNHQYNNSITIKGVKNSTTATDSWVTYDHRVNVEHNTDFTFNLERETLVDSHWEIRPIRIDFKKAANNAIVRVSVLYPETDRSKPGFKKWVAMESPSDNLITESLSKYCLNNGSIDDTNVAYGKRRYFTTDLIQELLLQSETENNDANPDKHNKSGECIIFKNTLTNNKKDRSTQYDHTITTVDGADKDATHTIWVYLDEYAEPNNSEKYRYATLRCEYFEVQANYEANEPDVTEEYIFRQNNVHKIQYNDHTYFVEYYEEYLYNYDSKEQYGNKDGMPWGLNGLQISDTENAVLMGDLTWNHSSIFGSPIENAVKNDVNKAIAEVPNRYDTKYDFYNSDDIKKIKDQINGKYTGFKAFDFAGYRFSKKIIEKAMRDDKIPARRETNAVVESAIEYCYNRNKRNSDGTINMDSMRWYLPAVDEIEEICLGGYDVFDDFRNKLYWSSQPAYKKYQITYNGKWNGVDWLAWLGQAKAEADGRFYKDNTGLARATKVNRAGTEVVSSDHNNFFGTLALTQSGETISGKYGEIQWPTNIPENSNITYGEGAAARANSSHRVRCVYAHVRSAGGEKLDGDAIFVPEKDSDILANFSGTDIIILWSDKVKHQDDASRVYINLTGVNRSNDLGTKIKAGTKVTFYMEIENAPQYTNLNINVQLGWYGTQKLHLSGDRDKFPIGKFQQSFYLTQEDINTLRNAGDWNSPYIFTIQVNADSNQFGLKLYAITYENDDEDE